MPEAGYTVYRYRWVLLAAYAGIQAGMQLLWITFAVVLAADTWRVNSTAREAEPLLFRSCAQLRR